MNSLSIRMKKYEKVYDNYLTPRSPVIIRLDGRAFHTYTRNFEKPFDQRIIDAMLYCADTLAEETQGFVFGYVQSDEASLLISDFQMINSEGWFGYSLNKIISLSASIFSSFFNYYMISLTNDTVPLAFFDSRAFVIPKEDVPNYFLWRYQDCVRNSIFSYASKFYTHAQLLNKNQQEQLQMIREAGDGGWESLSESIKYGTFIRKMDEFFIFNSFENPDYSFLYKEIFGD